MGIRRLESWIRPYRARVALMIVGDVTALVVGMIVPLVIAAAIDGSVARDDVAALWTNVVILLVLLLVQSAAFAFRFVPTAHAAQLNRELRTGLFDRLLRQPPAYHHRTGAGQAVARLVGDVEQIGFWYSNTSAFLISTIVSLLAATVMMVAIQPILGAVAVLALSPLTWVVWRARQRMGTAITEARRCAGELATASEESAVGVRVWKGVGGGPAVRARFDRLSRLARDAQIVVVDRMASNLGVTQGYPMLVLAGLIVAGIALVARGSLSVGDLVAFAAYYSRIQFPLVMLGVNLAGLQVAAVAADRLGDVFDTDGEIRSPDRPVAFPAHDGLSLRFDDVHFAYPGTEHPVLHGVELQIEPGEVLALVGATGSGKSTLLSLVNRLADPSAGRVLIDGVDVRDLEPTELRAHVGVAFEEAVLFSTSVADNLHAGRTRTTDVEVGEVLSVVQADFVHDLPDGANTIVGERGQTLSGGQRQRLALGRTLLGGSRILLLDDPTSALDVRTEEALLKRLRQTVAGSTVLLTARRPTTAMLADRVAVLQEGRVVAVGTHEELLRGSAEYRRVMIADDNRPTRELAAGHDQNEDNAHPADETEVAR
ncbi:MULTISPECIES: ABC transporter ATP-binding protein [Arthrobacter]|uniref:ABC transporter ATP-binding protein n=1 Tax=Arthrobacter terricola TaxID=2547396 RepID=A0A4R5KB90_9MICC|nr:MULTISPECIES: ABC transporter ATP-binding protein [Arthrobacter]MBT8163019.1 ABC transporter ATP-binding protein/permease [Arthrobacter sp. GN70]TDF91775.1 ABC transporter ATP-binding protein [Arthrobacter terricola]